MRITRKQADENKARVVETAAVLFREKGFDGVSIADLMHAADMTHGGFYNHFGSKDDLEAAACAHVFGKSIGALEAIAAIADPLRREKVARRDGGAMPDGRLRRRRVAPVAAGP
jgi:TetR/AcrR family transcriptional repressor of nem operon